MANSIFITAALSSNGVTINPALPIAFPDGLVGAPAITWASEPTSGMYRASAGVFRYAVSGADAIQFEAARLSVVASGSTIQVPSNGSFAFAATGFITAGGSTGTFLWRNVALSAGVGIDVATDAVFKVRVTALNAYATVDALNFTASGTAGVTTFGPAAVASITIKGGIVTAIS